MSVELLCVIVTVTLLLLVLTGLPFLVQVNITGAVLNSTKQSTKLVAPAIREEPMSLSDTLILGAINETVHGYRKNESGNDASLLEDRLVLKLILVVEVFPIQLVAITV